MNKNNIPIFFATDDNYIPFLAVTLQSIVDNSSKENFYDIKILNTSILEKNKQKILKFKRENVDIEFVNIQEELKKISSKLYTRDYYSKTTYYRLLIPDIYKEYDKALYLDSDIVLLDDVANLYNTDMEDNLVAATTDETVSSVPIFIDYVEKVVGVKSYKNYFNAGVLLMNLKAMRECNFIDKFVYLLDTVKFSVAQDQDYLNRICKGRVKILDESWNKMPLESLADKEYDESKIKLIHYNLAYKPWHFEDIKYKDYFWNYAKKTEFLDEILRVKSLFTDEDRKQDRIKTENLIKLAKFEADCVGDDRG